MKILGKQMTGAFVHDGIAVVRHSAGDAGGEKGFTQPCTEVLGIPMLDGPNLGAHIVDGNGEMFILDGVQHSSVSFRCPV